MPNINVPKKVLDLVVRHQFLHNIKGNAPVSRDDMVALMLGRADEVMSRPEGRPFPEQGVICFGPNEQVKHVGSVRWPAAEVSAALLGGGGPRLLVVYGRPGSRVTTHIQSIIASGTGEADVHDNDPGGNAVNIAGAMRTFEKGGKAIAALGVDSYQRVIELLADYTGTEWLNSTRGCELHQKRH